MDPHTQCDEVSNSSGQSTENDVTVVIQSAEVEEPKSEHLGEPDSREENQGGRATHTKQSEACSSMEKDTNLVHSPKTDEEDDHSFKTFLVIIGPEVTHEEGEDPSTSIVDMEVLSADVSHKSVQERESSNDNDNTPNSAMITSSADGNISFLSSDEKSPMVIDMLPLIHETQKTPQDGAVLSSQHHSQQDARRNDCCSSSGSEQSTASGKCGDKSVCESPLHDVSDPEKLGDLVPGHDSQGNDISGISSSSSSVPHGGNSSLSTTCQAYPAAITAVITCKSCNCEFTDTGSSQEHKCDNSGGSAAAETSASTEDGMGDLQCDIKYEDDNEFCNDKSSNHGSPEEHHTPNEEGAGCSTLAETSGSTEESMGDLPYDTSGKDVCKFCGEKFPDPATLKEHQQSHSNTRKPYQCFHCKKCFRFSSHLKTHYESHTSGQRYWCKTCGKSYKHSRHLEEHEILHTEEKAIKCEACGKLFAKQSALKSHMIAHTEERPCQCSICGKTFKTNYGMKEHERIHRGDESYKCLYCPEAFVYWRQWKAHERKEHQKGASPDETPYQCKICQKYLSSSGNLGRHVRSVHKGERPHACRYCDKTFKASNHLNVHEMIHSGERPFGCEECDKAFIAYSDLERHIRIHSGERPHKCRYCEKAFKQIGSLNGHISRKHAMELVMRR